MKVVPRFLEWLGAGYRLVLAALLLALLVAVDVAAGRNLSLTPFYLVVILFAVWSAGMIWGSVFLVASLFATVTVGELYGHPFTSRGSFVIDVAGRFLVYVIMVLVAGAARTAYAREQALARSDGLTGLPNRAALYERLGVEIEWQRRRGGAMALAYIDCDDFKRVNDGYGHAAGDRLLRHVAKVLEDGIRRTDLAARIGGDEFALILPEAGPLEAEVVIEKLRGKLDELPEARAGTIGFSIGVVVVRMAPPSADWLINQADSIMFSVKRKGKNSVALRVLDPPSEPEKRAKDPASKGSW